MLTADEYATLFRLAIPELRPTVLGDDSRAVLEKFSLVRAAVKRLWVATSESEALTAVSEQIATCFGDAATVLYTRRLAPGTWEWPYTVDRGYADRIARASQDFVTLLTPEQLDELCLFPRIAQPGEIATLEAYTEGQVGQVARNAWSKHQINDAQGNFITARVRTRRGLVAALTVTHKAGRVYSDGDRAVMATLAELASLALS